MKVERKGGRFLEDVKEWRLPGFLYTDELVLGGEAEGSLKVIV